MCEAAGDCLSSYKTLNIPLPKNLINLNETVTDARI